jgi:colanic acid/amylovoran biosynthesis glycosyltransferase
MKIAFLVSNFPKNSETFILNQITGLLDRGHKVNVFARREPSEGQTHKEIREYNLKEKTTYSNPPDNNIVRLLYGPIKILQSSTIKPQLVLDSLNFYEYGKDSLSLQALYMALSFNIDDYDLIFSHFGPNGNLGALLRRNYTNLNLVTMFHGHDIRIAIDENWHSYNPSFSESDMLLVNSKYNREMLIDLGADPEKIRIHPIAIDTERFHCSNNRNMNNTTKITITTVARLVEEKGHKFALEAMHNVDQQTNFDIKYRLIGSGPLESSLRRQARQLDLEDVVVFCGQCSRSGVVNELCQSDIFLLPSVDEGFGTVLLEAQSSQLPVVATRTGGIPEAVGDDASTLVESRDIEAMTNALIALIQNPEQRKAMGKTGRRFVVDNHSIGAANDLLESRFEMILGDGKFKSGS